jgi:hypothetical protein
MIKHFLSLALTTALTSATQLSEMFAQISDELRIVDSELKPLDKQCVYNRNEHTIMDCTDKKHSC